VPSLLPLALALAAAVALYLPALHTSFFADDYLFLDQVREKSLAAALRTPDPLSNFYRPISRQLYFWTVAGASNESAHAFHVAGLAAFLVLLLLLFGLARRLAGAYAATFATALLAVHYTADVPIRWACGSQELLSVIGALATVWLHLRGRTWLGAITMAFAALSKEVVLLTPLIALIADRRPGERWLEPARRAWPLALGVGAWAAVWVLAPHTRRAAGTEIEFNPWGPIATYLHLVQVIFGAEARKHEWWRLPGVGPPALPLLLALAAVFLAGAGHSMRGLARRGPASAGPPASNARGSAGLGAAASGGDGESRPEAEPGRGPPAAPPRRTAARELTEARRHAIATGAAWALLATLPVVAVAVLWSAYYYLFAMCGVAIALGAWLSARPRPWALALLALLAWGSNSARHLQEFATPRSPWTEMSHINKFYLERATRYCERYLDDLKRMRPALPRSSTLFFAGLKGNIAFQVANGPLMRWAYRDTSVRSYYLNNFTLDKARRGPLFFFVGSRDSLREMEPGADLYLRIAFSMLVNEWPPGARDALTLEREREPDDPRTNYWIAWCEWALGDTASARASLERAGYAASHAPAPETAEATAFARAGDIARALPMMQAAVKLHALDPAAHALLADLLLVSSAEDPQGPVEAFAARVLAPGDALMWRRWATIQMQRRRYLEALKSFDRYFKLAGPVAGRDGEAQQWVANIKRALPGGDIAPEGLRE